MQKTLTFKLDLYRAKSVLNLLLKEGKHQENTNQYVNWHIKGNGFSAVMYKSGKLVLQVSDVSIENKVLDLVNEQDESFLSHIGSDEVGKGDYFGPLVVCACLISEADLVKIKKYNITDSKKLDDEKILEMGSFLKDNLNHHVKIISPSEYNELNSRYKNVSIILAKAHIEVIESLYKAINGEASFVVVDQFSKNKNRLSSEYKLDIPLKQFHHGESDVAVAAASIIARYYFLKEFEVMNNKYGVKFPLGATHVIPFGKEFVSKFGEDELFNVAKVSFKTTCSIKG